jgi:hypothetical protein
LDGGCFITYIHQRTTRTILYFGDKQQTSRQTHTQETTKLTKENRTGKHKWKRAKCDHVQKKKEKPAKQIPSIIFFMTFLLAIRIAQIL